MSRLPVSQVAIQLRDEIIDAMAEIWELDKEPKRIRLNVREACHLMKLGSYWGEEVMNDIRKSGYRAFEKHGIFGIEVTVDRNLDRFEIT